MDGNQKPSQIMEKMSMTSLTRAKNIGRTMEEWLGQGRKKGIKEARVFSLGWSHQPGLNVPPPHPPP
jgi:hypothetical protein